MKMLIVATIGLLVAGSTVPASANQLDGEGIKSAIKGKTVTLNTRWGGFPLTYGQSGRVTGDGTGLGLARFFSPMETGRWWVEGNQLCQQFPTWYDGRQFCFRLEQAGANKLKWTRNDGASGTAVVRG